MDLIAEHEAFLRAIFDAPEDDTPRLVYADFLEENGEQDRADLIRVQCELSAREQEIEFPRRTMLRARQVDLLNTTIPWSEPAFEPGCSVERGFWRDWFDGRVEIAADDLANPVAFRARVVRICPAWFGAKGLTVRPGSRLLIEHVATLCSLPFVRQVTEWDLAGREEEVPLTECDPAFPSVGPALRLVPAISPGAVGELVRYRGARRITSLDLRNNNLDNDAARALVKSPYLDSLERLRLLEGNRLRGRVWQQVIERFGEDVAG